MSGIVVELIDTERGFWALEPEWKSLVTEAPDTSYFLTWEFISNRWKYFGEDRELFILAARDTESTLRGIAPFAIRRGSIRQISTRRLEFICRVEIPFRFARYYLDGEDLDVIAHHNFRNQVSAAIVDWLDRTSDRWDIVDLAWLSAHSPLRTHFKQSTRMAMERGESCVLGELPSDWSAFEHHVMGIKRAKQLRYQLRRLNRDFPGKVEFHSIRERDALDAAVVRLEDMKARQLSTKGRARMPEDDPHALRHRMFKRAFARAAFDRGWWNHFELKVDGALIAASCNLSMHEKHNGIQTAYEPEWKSYSPGNLIRAHEIQQSIASGVKLFDPGHGMTDSKRMWASDQRVDFRVVAKQSPRGIPSFLTEATWAIARETVKALLRRKATSAMPRPQEQYEGARSS